MLQEEGQRVSTDCSGFLGPELRWRRRQPVRSLHYHLLPDWEQPPDQLLLNTTHTGPAGVTSLNTAQKEIRVKGSDFLKRKTGSKVKRHSQIIREGQCMCEVSDFVQMWVEGISFHAGMNGRKPKHPPHVIEFPSVCSAGRCMLWLSGSPNSQHNALGSNTERQSRAL